MSLTQQPDLGERLRAADEQTLSEILRLYGPVARAILRSRFQGVLNASDIDDVLSIALFRLWQARETYDSMKSSLRVWFLRIAENAARDVLKFGWYQARRKEVSTDPPHLAEYRDTRSTDQANPTKEPYPTNVLDQPEHSDLREILADLPEPQRRIVLADALARDRVASSAHLAEELGIPASSIPVYRKRALEKIRKELRRRGHDVPE
ncbi:MAG: sigma-70 family RNA polymerase sigma factor [Planctomycetaceae bacterium]|nr:sigma-70 family RNA polymerase sigma factor [Planctomycetaceae bacterium]